ncbi:unnamed protein product, partial [Symbiodinium necroappetens]
MVERLGGNSSDDECVDVRLTSDEEEGEEPPIRTGPPAGPPPPVAVPIQALQSMSRRLSTVLASTLGITQGQVLTILHPHWAALQRITLEVRGMVPGEAMHPHLLHFADEAPPNHAVLEATAGPTLPEGPAIPPPTPQTPRAPGRRRRTPMTKVEIDTMEADQEIARMQVNLDIEEGLNADMADDEAENEDEDVSARPGSSTDHLRPSTTSTAATPAGQTSSSTSTRRSGTRGPAASLEDDDEEYVTVLLDEPKKPKKNQAELKGNKKSRPHLTDLMVGVSAHHRTPQAPRLFMMEHNEAELRKRTLIRTINRSQAAQAPTIKYRGRLRIVSYNCGGLSSILYQELVAWLKAEEARGEPVDIFCVQETAWREDFEFCTAKNHPLEPQWHAVHAGGPARTGILCFIRSSLLPADQIRYAVLMPGRALHVRLLFDIPLDLLLLYQVSWNPHKAELAGNKIDSLVQQRARLWHQVEQWLARIPLRNGTALIGDLNTPLYPETGLCGDGVVAREGWAQRDQEDLQALLRRAGCTALNTWKAPGVKARTFLPPAATDSAQGSQIDFIIVRHNLLDAKAQNHGAETTESRNPVPDIDGALLQGWQQKLASNKQQDHANSGLVGEELEPFNNFNENFGDEADNVYQAAKQFAPKTARRRLQLRTEQGHLQTAADEFRTIKQCYQDLYDGPAPTPDFLCSSLDFQLEEVLFAIKSLAPGKAMPSYSSPAALWNHLGHELAPQVLQQLNHVFTAGPLILPKEWCISELVLLPKPGKALTSPSHLRPIALLPPIAKVLASALAVRIQNFAASYLENTPQFAYLRGRSLQQALERVISHCAAVRALVTQQVANPRTRRSGREVLHIAGGLQLSLDVSQAYDGVSRGHLRLALLEAQIPENLITAILAIHNQAFLRISHDQYSEDI